MTASPKNFQMPTAKNPKVENESSQEVERDPSEDAIDQGVEESFPASDPVSVNITKIERTEDGEVEERGHGSK